MTPAQQLALQRLQQLRMTRRDRGDDGGGLAGLLGGAPASDVGPTSVPLDAEQGPAMGGGLLHQGPKMSTGGGITAPGKTHFFIRGRGPTIDFGPIFKPKSTGVDPMQGDPFQATSGVGGFFRRLLGDNSDELNAAWQKLRLERQLGLEDTAAARAAKAEELAAMQGFNQSESEKERAARAAEALAQRQFGAAENAADRLAREKLQASGFANDKTLFDLQNEANFLRDASQFNFGQALGKLRNEGNLAVAALRGLGSGREQGAEVFEPGKMYRDPKTGRMFQVVVDENTGRLNMVFADAGEKAGDELTADQRNLAAQRMAELKKAAAASEAGSPGTAMGGITSLLKGVTPDISDIITGRGINPAAPILKPLIDPMTAAGKDLFSRVKSGLSEFDEGPTQALERLAKAKEEELARKRAQKANQ